MKIDQVEWLEEKIIFKGTNKLLKNELSETKKYLEEILKKLKMLIKEINFL